MAFGGAAVGHLPSGKAALVQGGAPDETVRLAVIEEKRTLLLASIDEVIEPSPHRVAPRCVSADRCGGCGWMHLGIGSQRDWKRRLLRHELERAGLLQRPESFGETAQGEPLGQRIRTRMHRLGDLFGTMGHRSHEVVPLIECPILEPRLEAFALEVAAALEGSAAADAEVELMLDAEGARGMSVVLRSAGDPAPWQELSLALDVTCFILASSQGKLLASTGPNLRETSGGVTLEQRPDLFVQTNREMNDRLIEIALEAAGRGRRFAEIYAGVGNFTVHLARRFERGLACEGSRDAARLLEHNLGAARRTVEVRAERDRRSARWLATRAPADLLLVDPPRAGIEPLRPLFEASPPRRVVLVSCHPMAAVRDMAHLCQRARYRLEQVVPIDMFPQTPHLELMALLVR
jgi:23S rRNA (uracil1939-C5)-methyltransferase